VWNCTLNFDEIPDIDPYATSETVGRLYRKIYDAGRNVYPGNCMMGQLTQNGYAQQVGNGKILRLAYVETIPLLNSSLNPAEVYIRSDDEPRTVQSAHSLMLGFFPPDETTNVAELINLHTMDISVDDTNPSPALCPKLAEIWAAGYNTTEFKQHVINVTAPLIAEMGAALGYAVDLNYAFDCLNTHLCHDYPIPSGVSEDLYNRMMTELVYDTLILFNYPNTTYSSQLGTGFYLANFYNALNEFVNGTNQNVKFHLWSSHDLTLMAIATSMGFYDNMWVAYASMLNFELYEDQNSTWYVRVIYNGNVTALPACDYQEYCDYDTFSSLVTSLLPMNPEVSCQASSAETFNDPLFYMPPSKIMPYMMRKVFAMASEMQK